MKKIFSLILVLFVCLVSGCSCSKNDKPVRTTIFSSYFPAFDSRDSMEYILVAPFGTAEVSLTGYNEDEVNNLNEEFNLITYKYHSLLDRNYYYKNSDGTVINNIKVINDSYGSGDSIVVDEIIIEILKEGIKYTKLSNGKFNIFSGSIVDVWDSSFVKNSANYHVDPSESKINDAMLCVPSASEVDSVLVIDDENNTVIFNSFSGCESGASITLGALAKSYFLDKLSVMENFANLEAAIFNAGHSSIIVKGENPLREGGIFTSSVKDSLNGGKAKAVQLQLNEDSAISTSGGDYKGYIKDDGTRRHHIIDATSGYPNDYLLATTVVGDSAMISDIVTTTLMTMNSLEEIKAYLSLLKNNNIELKVLLQIIENNSLKLYMNTDMKNIIGKFYVDAAVEVFSYGA